MAYKVFTNGSVLNASEINENLMNQSVMVFSSSATRAAALTSPVEGMLTYLEDSNRFENYDGSSWVSPLGLSLIKTQVIGTGVSSVAVTNAFSAEFDSYKVLLAGGAASANANMMLRIGNAVTGYSGAGQGVTYAGTSSAYGGSNLSSWVAVGYGSTNTLFLHADISSPFQTKRTLISSHQVAPDLYRAFGGILDNNTSYTDFTILPQTASTYTGGTIFVYGYKKA